MAHAWKACWVHALAGSNPASSASQKTRPDLGNGLSTRAAGGDAGLSARFKACALVSVSVQAVVLPGCKSELNCVQVFVAGSCGDVPG